jgi:hypothetical protein
MNAHTKLPPLLQITDPDFAVGHEEAQLRCFADCTFLTDKSFVEPVRAMLTEYAVKIGLSEKQLPCSTGFIIGILARGEL